MVAIDVVDTLEKLDELKKVLNDVLSERNK
jgi:hypothetical protein